MKPKIITHIVLLIALSLIIILFGINGGWSVGLIATTLAVIIISFVIIPNWNTGGLSFLPIQLADLPSKERKYYLLTPFLIGLGMALLLGSWGDRLRVVGAILLLLNGIIVRLIKKNLPPEE